MAYANSFIVGSQTAQVALVEARINDICYRTDLQETFILAGNPPSLFSSWEQIANPSAAIYAAGAGITVVGNVIASTHELPSGVDVGSTANAYVVNPIPAVTLTQGASFTFTTTRANSGVTTMNASGTGVQPLRTITALPFTGGEIPGARQTYQATWDGVEWILTGTLNTGVPANPVGTLNLAGAYVIPTAGTQNGSSAGLTFMSTGASDVDSFDRQMLNFVWVSTDGGNFNYNLSMGFDGDDIFLITGSIQNIAIEVPTEWFRDVTINNQGTGFSFQIQQNNVPGDGVNAIQILQPVETGNAIIYGIDATIGKTNVYNGIPTVSGGQPAEYATVDLVGQDAAISATDLYTPLATGMFRISVYAKVTTPDGASSSLGGSAGLTIGYTDGTDSVPQTTVAQLATQAGAAAIVNAGNTTATKLLGSVVIFAKTGVPITYAFDYASGTPAAMAYEIHLKVEAL